MTLFSVGDVILITGNNVQPYHYANDGSLIQRLNLPAHSHGSGPPDSYKSAYDDGCFDAVGHLVLANRDDGNFGHLDRYDVNANLLLAWNDTDAGMETCVDDGLGGQLPLQTIWNQVTGSGTAVNALINSIVSLPDRTLLAANNQSHNANGQLVKIGLDGSLLERIEVDAGADSPSIYATVSLDGSTVYYTNAFEAVGVVRSYDLIGHSQNADIVTDTDGYYADRIGLTIDEKLIVRSNGQFLKVYDPSDGSLLASLDVLALRDPGTYLNVQGSFAPDPFDANLVWLIFTTTDASQDYVDIVNLYTGVTVLTIAPDGAFGNFDLSGLVAYNGQREIHPAVHRLANDGSSVWRTRTT